MRFILLFFSLCVSFQAYAQPTNGLVSHFTFDNNDFTEQSGNGQNAIYSSPNAQFRCGVNGNAVYFNGIGDQMTIFGVNNVFNTRDFTVSFYIKPEETLSGQVLLSKRENCNSNNAFGVTYKSPLTSADAGTLEVLISENTSKTLLYREGLNASKCWQHVVFMREGSNTKLYMNGVLIDEKDSVTRIDLTNSSELVIGGGPCLSAGTIPYKGLLDEFRLYDRALSDGELASLYLAPEEITTRDTLIFLGTSIDIDISNTCASSFAWTPSEGVSSVVAPEPTLSPSETTVYTLEFDLVDCVASDSIRVVVVDPADLECDNIFLPKAFTPNGDGRNENYGISNPFAIQELISFEIFDRWGGRVFYTEDAFERWDGTFRGKEMNPGVFLYRIYYRCGGENNTNVGRVTILR